VGCGQIGRKTTLVLLSSQRYYIALGDLSRYLQQRTGDRNWSATQVYYEE
jgi:hypothetical protein